MNIKVFDKELESILLSNYSILYKNGLNLKYDETRKVRSYLISIISFLYENNGKRIHSSKLKYVFGRDYHKYINVLESCNIIEIESYLTNKYCKLYRIKPGPYISLTSKHRFSKNEKCIKELCEKHHQKCLEFDITHKTKISDKVIPQEFYDTMKLIKIMYPKQLTQYINDYIYRNPDQEKHFRDVEAKWSSPKGGLASPIKIDRNNRKYSLLTSTPRVLRPFLNIKFSADVHNSHPLLIVKLIEDKLNLTSASRTRLINLIRNVEVTEKDGFTCYKCSACDPDDDSWYNPFRPITTGKPNQKFIEKHYHLYGNCYGFYAHQISLYKTIEMIKRTLSSQVKDEGERETIESVPQDVWEYIILAFKGKLWNVLVDNPMAQKEGMIRQDVKALMFGEVFYSHGTTTRGKKWGKMFASRFPNVFKAIAMLKKEDPDEHLANKMMRLESELFQRIMSVLYSRGFKVVTIHDAVEVVKHKDNKNCTEAVVEKIMKDVYRNVGLDPDVSIESSDKSDISRMMDELRILRAYKEQLEVRGNPMNPERDKDAEKIMRHLRTGQYELMLDKAGKPFLHKVLEEKVRKVYGNVDEHVWDDLFCGG